MITESFIAVVTRNTDSNMTGLYKGSEGLYKFCREYHKR